MVDNDVLTIHGKDDNVRYHIEPTRFELNKSRVQMIDIHLATVPKGSEDIDILLDARKVFALYEDENWENAPDAEL